MKLSVPSRFEYSLLENIKELNKKHNSVGKIYGSLPYSIIGHGRVSEHISKFGLFNIDTVREFTEKAHSIGIEVNYLANTLCLGDLGYEKGGSDKIIKYFGEVYETGVDIITIASPFLQRIIKGEFPSLKTEISVYAEIDTIQKFRRWENLGADIINLPAKVNRDIALLETISESREADIELLVNESCLFHCPYSLYHHTVSAHRSRSSDEGLDYCMMECVKDRLNDTSELLKSGWIRPEDISYYEKTFNIEKFKIQGRQMPIEWINNTVESYSTRKYDGNLLDLISPTYPNWSSRSTTINQLPKQFSIEDIKNPDVYIDNRQLDIFFKTIINKGGCGPLQNCDDCKICRVTANKLVQIRDQQKFDKYSEATKWLLEDTVHST